VRRFIAAIIRETALNDTREMHVRKNPESRNSKEIRTPKPEDAPWLSVHDRQLFMTGSFSEEV
jgi:hypothetical protein